jgi:hypothetical protein
LYYKLFARCDTVVLSPCGSEEGLVALLPHLTPPERPLFQVQQRYLPLLLSYYRLLDPWGIIWRMAVTDNEWPGASTLSLPALPRVRRLAVTNIPSLQELHRSYPESSFSADLFAEGINVGIFEDEQLVAAGGTHALVPAHKLAVVGNILTAPQARNKGYATAIIAALIEMLFQ